MSLLSFDPAQHYAIVNLGEPWHDWRLGATKDATFAQHGDGPEARWIFRPSGVDGYWQITTEAAAGEDESIVVVRHGETEFSVQKVSEGQDVGNSLWAFRGEGDDVGGVSILSYSAGNDSYLGLDPLPLLQLRMGPGGKSIYRWNVQQATSEISGQSMKNCPWASQSGATGTAMAPSSAMVGPTATPDAEGDLDIPDDFTAAATRATVSRRWGCARVLAATVLVLTVVY